MRRIIAVSAAFLLAFLHSPARADLIVQGTSFSASGPAGFDFLGVEPFGDGLGTLNNVSVSIDGVIQVTGTTLGLVPYEVSVDVDLTGLAGRYFDFATPGMQFNYSGTEPHVVCSIGGCTPVEGPLMQPATTFSLDFTFTDFAESLGINQAFLNGFSAAGSTTASPPPTISGAVSDFIADPFVPLDEIDLIMSTSFVGGATFVQAELGGAMFITYDYTPRAVPEPGTFALLLIGLAGLGLRGKRRH